MIVRVPKHGQLGAAEMNLNVLPLHGGEVFDQAEWD